MAFDSLAWMLLAVSLVATSAASPLQKSSSQDEHEFIPEGSGESELQFTLEGSGEEKSQQKESESPVVDFSFFLNPEVTTEEIDMVEIFGDNLSENLEVNVDEDDRVGENKETSTEFGEQAFQFSKDSLKDENIETTFLGTIRHNTATSQATEEPMYGTDGTTEASSTTTETTTTKITTPTQTTTQTISSSSSDATIQSLTETTSLQDLHFPPTGWVTKLPAISTTTRKTTPLTKAPAISTTSRETTPSTKAPAISTTTRSTTTLDPINVHPSENFVEFERLFQRRLWKQAEFDSDDIVDVVTNFIYKRNPMLQLLLSICFVHPKCYSLEDVYMKNVINHKENSDSVSETGALVEKLLREKRREAARNIMIDLLLQVQVEIKEKMFHYFTTEVARRGRTVQMTKTIIDSVKVIWEKTNDDLESAKVSIRELFYLLPLESNTEIIAIVQMSETAQKITQFVDSQYQAAILDKTNNKRQSRNFGVWDEILNF